MMSSKNWTKLTYAFWVTLQKIVVHTLVTNPLDSRFRGNERQDLETSFRQRRALQARRRESMCNALHY